MHPLILLTLAAWTARTSLVHAMTLQLPFSPLPLPLSHSLIHSLLHSQASSSAKALPKSLDLLQTSILELGVYLDNGSVSSVDLVNAYLENIAKDNIDGLGLRAVIETAPREQLTSIAQKLDEERAAGKTRSKLHGIPILLKANTATDPELGMTTSAGSYALNSSVVPRDAFLVHKLRQAGAIIIAKTNLNELSGFKAHYLGYDEIPTNRSMGTTNGWSAIGGQTSSAYVKGGYEAGGNPWGSSAGSAVALSAGWGAGAFGTDTTGSVLYPANRAALFGIRPTVGLISRAGTVPVTLRHDTAGTMGMTAYDAALLVELTAGYDERDWQTSLIPPDLNLNLTHHALHPPPLSSFTFGIPRKHLLPRNGSLTISPTGICPHRIRSITEDIIQQLASAGAKVVDGTDLDLDRADFEKASEGVNWRLICDFRDDLERYLDELVESEVRTLEELINYNDRHADIEMPPEECCQERLIQAVSSPRDSPRCQNATSTIESLVQARGLDHIFSTYDIDALILSPELGRAGTIVGGGNYPAGVVPIGHCDNGLPFGLMVVVPPWKESRLVGIMAAMEKEFPQRRPPGPLVNARAARV